MDFTTTFDQERKRLTVKANCMLDAHCFDKFRAFIMSYLEGTEGWNLIIDHSGNIPENLDYRQVNMLTTNSIVFDALKLGNFLVVVSEKHYGFGRMWEIMASDKMSCNTRVFKSIEQATGFLENA